MPMLPQLKPELARELRDKLEKDPSFKLSRLQDYMAGDEVFPPTGYPITQAELLRIREAVIEAAEKANGSDTKFDLYVGQTLASIEDVPVGEFGNPRVWDFLTLVLLPDVADQRFQISASGGRYTGGNRRHIFQRLWKRWAVFDESVMLSDRPLREDDFVALQERQLTSIKRNLANACARKIMANESQNHREYTRLFSRQLIFLSGRVGINDQNPDEVQTMVDLAHQLTVAQLRQRL